MNGLYCVQKEIRKIARAVVLWHEVNQSNIPLCDPGRFLGAGSLGANTQKLEQRAEPYIDDYY